MRAQTTSTQCRFRQREERQETLFWTAYRPFDADLAQEERNMHRHLRQQQQKKGATPNHPSFLPSTSAQQASDTPVSVISQNEIPQNGPIPSDSTQSNSEQALQESQRQM